MNYSPPSHCEQCWRQPAAPTLVTETRDLCDQCRTLADTLRQLPAERAGWGGIGIVLLAAACFFVGLIIGITAH